MTERILVPKIPFATARFNSASSSGIGFITCTPSLSSASPLSTFKNGTTRFFVQRNSALPSPSMSRSMVPSKRIAPSTRSPVNALLLIMRVRIACMRSNICASPEYSDSSIP